MSNFAVPRLSPNKRQSYRPPSAAGMRGNNGASGGGTLRRPASTMSLRSTSGSIRRPSTPSSFLRATSSGSGISSKNTSPTSSRPSSSLSSRSVRPGSSLGRLGQRPSSSLDSVYNGTISVSVRPKPPGEKIKTSWIINSEESSIYSPELGDFTFDSVFGLDVNNQYVYESAVIDVVKKTLDGFNGTVFAYGMTGSGKTHSMQGTASDPGIIPLAVNDVFHHIDLTSHLKKYTVKVSYLEIYNEKIFDLLALNESTGTPIYTNTANSSTDLKIRDDLLTGVKVMGLSEESASNVDELLSVVERGDLARKTGATDYNSRSSRSHAVVLIRINSVDVLTKAETISTLSLCDLAGSERATTQTDRRKEGSYINKSLLALSTVIAKLSVASSSRNNSSALGHVPYRDSKLTRLLQPALSGNSVISILCTIHLGESTYSETVNTLRFAAKAKNVTLKVSKHELLGGANAEKDRIIEKLQNTVQKQKIEMDLLKASNGLNNLSLGALNGNSATPSTSSSEDASHLRTEMAELQSENRLLTERVEHLTRLTDEKRTEQVIMKNDIMNVLMSTRALLNDTTTIRNLEELFKLQTTEIDEYKSYILHLENELGKYEVKRYFYEHGEGVSATTAATLTPMENGNSAGYSVPLKGPLSPIPDLTMNGYGNGHGLISPSKVRNNVMMNGNQRELQNLIQLQKEEIEELQESMKDKDRIIKALRTSNRFKNSLMN